MLGDVTHVKRHVLGGSRLYGQSITTVSNLKATVSRNLKLWNDFSHLDRVVCSVAKSYQLTKSRPFATPWAAARQLSTVTSQWLKSSSTRHTRCSAGPLDFCPEPINSYFEHKSNQLSGFLPSSQVDTVN